MAAGRFPGLGDEGSQDRRLRRGPHRMGDRPQDLVTVSGRCNLLSLPYTPFHEAHSRGEAVGRAGHSGRLGRGTQGEGLRRGRRLDGYVGARPPRGARPARRLPRGVQDAAGRRGWAVAWALGRLAELAPPDAYGEVYKRWRLETLPILPERFKVRVTPKTREQFNVVKGLMRDPSVPEVVNACDAGREGGLILD